MGLRRGLGLGIGCGSRPGAAISRGDVHAKSILLDRGLLNQWLDFHGSGRRQLLDEIEDGLSSGGLSGGRLLDKLGRHELRHDFFDHRLLDCRPLRLPRFDGRGPSTISSSNAGASRTGVSIAGSSTGISIGACAAASARILEYGLGRRLGLNDRLDAGSATGSTGAGVQSIGPEISSTTGTSSGSTAKLCTMKSSSIRRRDALFRDRGQRLHRGQVHDIEVE